MTAYWWKAWAAGRCRLRQGRRFSDMAADFHLPILLVIGNKLGAINHALLTLDAIKARGLECLGHYFQ